MIFHFRTPNVTFFEEDQAYFEKKFLHLKTFLGNEIGDQDTADIHVFIDKNKHESGERFEAKVTMHTKNHGKFHAEEKAENIKKCADLLYEKLRCQIKKFHEKHIG